jgi:uncharacterized membrane protein YeaQ/YmgE (transglycosylase-associated protein family)
MTLIQIVPHAIGFLLTPILLGLLASLIAKALWRGALRQARWPALAARCVGASLLVAVAGLMLSGRDGHVLTYAFMVLSCAVVLAWSARAAR